MKKSSLILATLTLAACAQTDPSSDSTTAMAAAPPPTTAAAEPAPDVVVILTGDVESPPVSTPSTGRALIVVDDDGLVRGVVEAPDMSGSTAAIEDDAPDAEPTTVVLLIPAGDGRWQIPAGTRLSAKQQAHYKAGNLYANVRTDAHPKGEVRAQLRDKSRARSMDAAASGAAPK
jgi:hypothetical protein